MELWFQWFPRSLSNQVQLRKNSRMQKSAATGGIHKSACVVFKYQYFSEQTGGRIAMECNGYVQTSTPPQTGSQPKQPILRGFSDTQFLFGPSQVHLPLDQLCGSPDLLAPLLLGLGEECSDGLCHTTVTTRPSLPRHSSGLCRQRVCIFLWLKASTEHENRRNSLGIEHVGMCENSGTL